MQLIIKLKQDSVDSVTQQSNFHSFYFLPEQVNLHILFLKKKKKKHVCVYANCVH